MSRLRARTWTRTERIAAYYRLPLKLILFARPPMCVLRASRFKLPSREEAVKIHEQTVRAKGVDVRSAWMEAKHPSLYPPRWEPEDLDELREITSAQKLARRPYLTMRALIGTNKLMRCCIGRFDDWVPSDSSPNIFVRRSA